MATYKFSEMATTIKRISTLTKWIGDRKMDIQDNAFANRNEINKRELQWEMSRLDCLIKLWDVFKKLRKKSEDYDVLINIDRKGYLTIRLTFPISQDELDKAFALREAFIQQNGRRYSCCVRMDEEVYNVVHNRVEKVFKGIQTNPNGSYEKYLTSLVRIVDFVSC